MPSVSAVIATTLSAHVHDVFGVMGNGNAYFLDALETTSTVFTPVRHEAAAVAAADAYFRACGRLAAATARIGVATAELYPDIRLGASLGAAGLLADFGEPLTQQWSMPNPLIPGQPAGQVALGYSAVSASLSPHMEYSSR